MPNVILMKTYNTIEGATYFNKWTLQQYAASHASLRKTVSRMHENIAFRLH